MSLSTEDEKPMSPVHQPWTPHRQPIDDHELDTSHHWNNSFTWQVSTYESPQACVEPVRYVDERTKALGRKAELEALRRRNELALKKAAFNADSPIATSTFASFFQQQQNRRMVATQLRLGALSSLNDYRLRDVKGIIANHKATTYKRQYPLGSPSAYSKMADIDHFLGVEWRERKKRLQAYRQQEWDAKQPIEQDESEDVYALTQKHASPQRDLNSDNSSIPEKEDTATAAFLDSILLVHAELQGFFAAASSPDVNAVDTPAEKDQHIVGGEENLDTLVGAPRWNVPEGTYHTPILLTGDHGEMDFMDEENHEQGETDDCNSTQELLSDCADLMAQAEAMLQETEVQQQESDPTIFITESEDTEKLAHDIGQAAAINDNLPLNLHSKRTTDETIQKFSLDVAEERSFITGFDAVPRSSIEEHMRDIVAMQASLSFSKSDLQDTSSPSHDDGSARVQRTDSCSSPQRNGSPQLLDPICGPRLNFVSDVQTDVVVKDSKSTSTDLVHDPNVEALHPNEGNNDIHQMQCVSLASHTIPATDDLSISSIGSSIGEQSAADAGGVMLSRQSSASSLSSFWRQDFEPKQANDARRKQYNSTLLMCDSEQYLPNLHNTKAACERCFSVASTPERVKFLTTGRHVRIMLVRGGCHRSCTAYPRRDDQPPVRLCRKCYFDCHRAPKK